MLLISFYFQPESDEEISGITLQIAGPPQSNFLSIRQWHKICNFPDIESITMGK